jgi:hypothetical protein
MYPSDSFVYQSGARMYPSGSVLRLAAHLAMADGVAVAATVDHFGHREREGLGTAAGVKDRWGLYILGDSPAMIKALSHDRKLAGHVVHQANEDVIGVWPGRYCPLRHPPYEELLFLQLASLAWRATCSLRWHPMAWRATSTRPYQALQHGHYELGAMQ